MSKIQPVVLSGGAGTRLWPASRSMFPKQLLPLASRRTMLQETLIRLRGIEGCSDNALVVCNEAHRFLIADQLRDIASSARLILEPEGRNTAPAVALAALLASGESAADTPLLLVIPADHVVDEPGRFRAAVAGGVAAADAGQLVTFGIPATRPETGYGYIRADAAATGPVAVEAFVEKPDAETAAQYVASGGYFWNSGMFLFRTDIYLDALQEHAPDILSACSASIEGISRDGAFLRPDREAFAGCRDDSIDYAVMEKTRSAVMVPLDAGWSDVGSWSALHDACAADANGNTVVGDVTQRDCYNSYINAGSRLVVAVGLDDAVVVETSDAVLVSVKEKSQDVKKIVDDLRRRKRVEANSHRQVFRPWGSYDSIDSGDGFQVKRLIVNPGATLSLQKHAFRAEHWTVVSGRARVTLDDRQFDLAVNESTYVPVGAVHRIQNPFDEPVHIIEVQCGSYLGEDDIVRIDDEYGREGTNT
ncbi:MAG: mannose-1-phosphate guanylyltransferase/mannose-6-phosphate isomerase [Gammaproteobacteria bacterium]|nr:mannose-1-phosphate guanylyltransferase/mannose-6-phosphate isomerase [Gammaproteobacteria bacterium]